MFLVCLMCPTCKTIFLASGILYSARISSFSSLVVGQNLVLSTAGGNILTFIPLFKKKSLSDSPRRSSKSSRNKLVKPIFMTFRLSVLFPILVTDKTFSFFTNWLYKEKIIFLNPSSKGAEKFSDIKRYLLFTKPRFYLQC